jgi:hypothetical protein
MLLSNLFCTAESVPLKLLDVQYLGQSSRYPGKNIAWIAVDEKKPFLQSHSNTSDWDRPMAQPSRVFLNSFRETSICQNVGNKAHSFHSI